MKQKSLSFQNDMKPKELILSSIPSNGLEIASYGLSVPKTVIKRTNKAKDMVKKQKETIPEQLQENKPQTTEELVISSKNEVAKKKEVKKKVIRKKETRKKQRKGKSLLTAFRINRMTRRTVLNLNRGERGHKYV